MVQMVRKKQHLRNISVFGKSKQGFTFLELMVVLFIIGLIAAIALPNLQGLLPGYKRREFIANLQTIFSLTRQHALATNKAHRVFFDFKKRTIQVEYEDTISKEGQPIFKPVQGTYQKYSLQWPETVEIKQFYIQGQDEMARAGREVLTGWVYIVPQGYAQDLIINMMDGSKQISLVLNPFTMRLKVYDSFQKP